TEYEYDEANRLVWIEDANDHKTKYEYDKNGRRIASELPLGQKSYTTYDAVGNIYTTTDFNGDSISYQYDAQNRLIKKEFSAASGQVPVTFTYTPSGQIDKIVDARGTTSFKYDERNHLISRTDPNGVYLASGHTIEYGYDGLGNRTEVRTPNGNVAYTYDEQNRLKTVTSSQGTTSYFYDVAGNLVKTELPNAVVETRDYDQLNRLKLVKNVKDGVVVSSFDYTLDLVGHRRVITEQNGRKVEYEYDSLYRLTKETINDAVAGNRIIEYTYDKVGNRLTKNDSVEGITTYTYDDNDRLKTEELKKNNVVVQTIEYRYDDNGNLKSRIKNGVEEVSYTWDKENRLIGVRKANGEVISYQYDSDGVRVSSTVNGVKTEYLVDKNLPYAQVLEERVNNGLTAGYVYGNDLISQQRGSEKSFYLVDGLGSTRGLTNGSGVVTDRYSYDAFGNLIGSTNNVQNNYLFAGEQFDKSLGDYYLRARYYDTDTGRFTRRDSYEGRLREPLTLHKYLYGNASPINFTDPSGLFSIQEGIATTAILSIILSIPSSTPQGAIPVITTSRVPQVRGSYDRATGTLILHDLSGNTPSPLVINGLFSGNDPHKNNPQFESIKYNGPIPGGNYEIFKNNDDNPTHAGWYRLDRIDSNPRNDRDDDLYGRDGFRLHPGRSSQGCITVPLRDTVSWQKIAAMLNGTNKEEDIRERKGTLWWAIRDRLRKWSECQ
uniref:RHS repeat-associated core domain-containing protein n=1 Tax=Argonema antarcticum TaxID=2942763 RepID=UPI00201224AD